MIRSQGLDSNELSSQPISRRAAIFGMGAGGLALALGGIGFIGKTRAPSLPRSPEAALPSVPPEGTTMYTYRGHTGVINTAVWSPSSGRIASGSADKSVQVWQATTGGDVLVYKGHTGAVNGAAWSPDGKYLASASDDGTAHIWDAVTGHQIVVYKGHTGAIDTVAWSPDGTRVVSSGEDGTAQVWSVATGRQVLAYRPHLGRVYSSVWWPHSKYVVSAGQNGAVHVWDSTTGKTAFVFLKHGAAVQQARWSPNGAFLAVCSLRDKAVRVWDARTRRLVYTYRGQPHGVQAITWSPDSKYIASAGPDGMIAIWHATTGARVFSFLDPSGTVAATPTASGPVTHKAGGTSANQVPGSGAATEELAVLQEPADGLWLDGEVSGTKTVDWSTNGNYYSSGGHNGSVTVTATGSRW